MNADRLAHEVIVQATLKGYSLATCESLTGGALGAALTDVPGSSAVYAGGFVTYATRLKIQLIGLDADFAAVHGVVNEKTARQMAEGALRLCGTDLAVSTTGVAGPSSQDGHQPGEVWIGMAWHDGDQVCSAVNHFRFSGTRDQIRQASVEVALSILRDELY